MHLLILGCGSIGERHLRVFNQVEGVQCSICDPRDERRQILRSEYEVAESHARYEDADLSCFDAVAVCTPTDQHMPQARRAVAAGCHVFVEKPISTTMDGVDELIAEAAEAARVVQVGYVLRHHPNVRRMKELLDQEAIGAVLSGRLKAGYYVPKYRPDYRGTYWAHAATGGGVLYDCSHHLDWAQWFLGPVAEVACFAGHTGELQQDEDVEDLAVALLRFESGPLVSVNFSDSQKNYSSGCELIGSEGTITWDYGASEVSLYRSRTREWERWSVELERDDFFITQARSFAEAVRGEHPPTVTGEDGRRALAVVLAALQSARTGMAVRVGSTESD